MALINTRLVLPVENWKIRLQGANMRPKDVIALLDYLSDESKLE